MTLPDSPRRFSETEYLLLERAAETKSEFIDGHIIAMTGATRAHSLIAGNVAAALRRALGAGPCEVHQSDLRVQVAEAGLYAYPDVLVVCEPVEIVGDHGDMIRNPVLIVEVLSSSTEAYDRGEKFLRYQRLASLQHYLLIDQVPHRVEHFRRTERGWHLETFEDPAEHVALDALRVTLTISDVYTKVT